MMDNNNITGGFVGTNTGSISECYSYYISKGRDSDIPFAGRNEGSIRLSFESSRGSIRDHWSLKGSQSKRDIKSEDEARAAGYDVENTWVYDDERGLLIFREDNWKTGNVASDSKPTYINNENELLKYIDLVNGGNKKAASAHIILNADISLRGRKIDPIGVSRKVAFTGVFDGNGHMISDYTVQGRDIGAYGFFGYNCGTVINLTLDGSVIGEGNVGALCGVNEGRILCCGTYSDIYGKGDKLRLGGFCGSNIGIIEKSCGAARIHRALIPLIPIGIIASLLMLIGIIMFMAIPAAADVDQIYSPIESDEDQIKIAEEEEPPAETLENTMSFRFDETLHIDPATGNVYLNFENPSYSTNKVVISLYSEDDNGGRTLLAESKAIEPGFGLSYLTLNHLGYEAVNSGVRKGYIVLNAYNEEDDSKAMVDSTLPVNITIE
ncbi:MAG: hypothetical protein J6N76_03875 [Lachnospiraceae bacterium]|nr:hypothetical protein [Lachnospiraceae bacterium]